MVVALVVVVIPLRIVVVNNIPLRIVVVNDDVPLRIVVVNDIRLNDILLNESRHSSIRTAKWKPFESTAHSVGVHGQ